MDTQTQIFSYLVVIEEGPEGCGISVPDLPGCMAAADTREEALAQIREVVQRRIGELRDNNREIPRPVSKVEVIEVAVPSSGS